MIVFYGYLLYVRASRKGIFSISWEGMGGHGPSICCSVTLSVLVYPGFFRGYSLMIGALSKSNKA
jgi:hypothetical protein